MKPILRYYGAKWKIANWIVGNLQPHTTYIEPYFGSGAIFFNKKKAQNEIINDIDEEIVNFFKVCREHPEELARAINLTPYARVEFLKTMENIGGTELERARRMAIRCWMGYGGKTYGRDGWKRNTNTRNSPNNAALWGRLPEIVIEAGERLKGAQIENTEAVPLIKQYNNPDTLIYADPPYIQSTRSSPGNAYKMEIDDKEHEELLQALLDHKGQAVISGYDSPLYADALKDWDKRQITTIARSGGKRLETIWMNFCPDKQITIF